jgi:hypothetical protein
MKPEAIPFWEQSRGDGPVTRALADRERLAKKIRTEQPWRAWGDKVPARLKGRW